MGIYLGNVGSIEITRKSLSEEKFSIVNPSDVNSSRNRFSFDFEEGTLITGDFVELTATDGTNLDFVTAAGWANGIVQSSGNWYVFIDDMGGIKLYNNFDDSLAGEATGIISLATIARDIPIRVVVRDRNSRLLGCIVDYELNTNRETVDITALSDQYRQQYSALITGSGSLTAQWDYLSIDGDETVHYLMQLVLRTEIGSGFRAKMYIKSQNTAAAGGSYSASQFNDSLWWEFDAIATNSATNFASGNIIVTRIDFVTTGPIKLRAKTITANYLLQESGGKIVLDQDPSSYLLLDEAE